MARNNLQIVNKSRSERYQTTEKTEETKEIKKKTKKKKDETIEEKETHPIIKKVFTTTIIIIVLFISYIMFIEPNIFVVKEYKIESEKLPNSFHGQKIIHISDLNYGTSFTSKDLETITKKIKNLKPDILIFSGNLIDKNIALDKENKELIIKNLLSLESVSYKFSVIGKNDNTEIFQEIMRESGFTILDNTSTLVYNEENTPILISGISSDSNDFSFLNTTIEELDTTNLFKIIISHSAELIDNIIDTNPDLVLSGNTLGGLLNPGFTKPLLLKDNQKYYKQYYKINNTELFVSNGLGTSDINMRFNNFPTINFFRLSKTKTTS